METGAGRCRGGGGGGGVPFADGEPLENPAARNWQHVGRSRTAHPYGMCSQACLASRVQGGLCTKSDASG